MSEAITKVGIGVAVVKLTTSNTQILLGKRKGSHGKGEWAFPGGHLEHLESFEQTARRELTEEVGPNFKVSGLRVVSVINLIEYAPKHYIDIGMVAKWESGDPVVMEPDKCEGWEWIDIDEARKLTSKFATVDRIIDRVLATDLDGTVKVYDVG